MSHGVFLSYKREDERFTARLAKALEAEGLSIWWDRSLLHTDSRRNQILAALEAARAAANSEARVEAEILCAGFANTGSYRILSAAPELDALDCETYSGGTSCSGRSEAVCAVEVREAIETEICRGLP